MSRFTWPIVDPDLGFLDLCAEAWADLHLHLADRGERLTGRPEFTVTETPDGRLWLHADAVTAPWQPQERRPAG